MMHVQCNFTLTLALDSEAFSNLLCMARDKGQDYQSFYDTDSDIDCDYIDHSLESKGVTVSYHDNPHKKKIKFKVDPNYLLDDKLTSGNITKYLHKLESCIDKYFDSEYGLDNFKLGKMGFITDIDVHSRENVDDYIKILKKLGKVKGFSASNDNGFNKDISFCLDGNSNGIDFTIYDLEKLLTYQMLESEAKRKELRKIAEKAKGILHVELWLTTPKTIRDFTNESLASEQIPRLLKNSEKILIDNLARIIPYGNYYKKSEAIEIITREIKNMSMRRKMLRLITLIPEKKSLLLAQKALNYRKIDYVMYKFFSINVSPVTISKRHDTKFMQNLYDFF